MFLFSTRANRVLFLGETLLMTPLVTVKCSNCRAKTFFRTDVPLKCHCTECGDTIRVNPGAGPNRGLILGAVAAVAIAGTAVLYAATRFSG